MLSSLLKKQFTYFSTSISSVSKTISEPKNLLRFLSRPEETKWLEQKFINNYQLKQKLDRLNSLSRNKQSLDQYFAMKDVDEF